MPSSHGSEKADGARQEEPGVIALNKWGLTLCEAAQLVGV